MFKNPFIHARNTGDWVIGLVIAVAAGIICAGVLIIITAWVG